MERYGRLVMTICQRALQNQHDAEDVFQATFLVLAEKAAKIKKRESLPSWLSGVAHRLSMNLARKRHRKDLSLKAEPEAAARDHFADLERRFDAQAMDEELHALPAKYRDALVRFYFLNQTSRQIAEALGITQGSADGRIKRGRQELRIRLARRGVALGAFTVMAISAQTASAALAPTVMQSTLHAAVATKAAGLCSPSALDLAGTELMKTSSLMSSVAAVTAAVVLLGLGVFGANAAFARAALPGELPINTVVESVEVGSTVVNVAQGVRSQTEAEVRAYQVQHLQVTDMADLLRKRVPGLTFDLDEQSNSVVVEATPNQHGDIKQEIEKLDIPPKENRARVDSGNGTDVYKVKADQLDARIAEAKKVAPNANYRKRSDRLIVDGTGAELAKVEKLFAKAGVTQISQERFNDPLKADDLLPSDLIVTATYRIDPPLETTDAGDVLKRLNVGRRVVVDVEAKALRVTGTKQDHEEAGRVLKGLLDATTAPVGENQGDLYKFKTAQSKNVANQLGEKFPTAYFATTSGNRLAVLETPVDVRKQIAAAIEKIEEGAFQRSIVSKAKPVYQDSYAATKLTGIEDFEERIQELDSRLRVRNNWGRLTVIGTQLPLAKVREFIDKEVPDSFLGRKAVNAQGDFPADPSELLTKVELEETRTKASIQTLRSAIDEGESSEVLEQLIRRVSSEEKPHLQNPSLTASRELVATTIKLVDTQKKLGKPHPQSVAIAQEQARLRKLLRSSAKGSAKAAVGKSDDLVSVYLEHLELRLETVQRVKASLRKRAGKKPGSGDSVNKPPTFATAKLSVDGKSVMLNDPNAPQGVRQTYTVRVPYTVTRIDEDGEEVNETRFREETRTRTVFPNGRGRQPRKVYKLTGLKVESVSQREGWPPNFLKQQLDGKKPVVLLKPGEQLSDAFRQVLKPDTIVITLPKSEPKPAVPLGLPGRPRANQ